MSLNSLIAKIPAFATATAIEKLEGGLTNTNYKISTPARNYFMRVSHNSTHLLGIDRFNERINTERANQAGVGPAVIDFLPTEKVLVIEWINARTLHAADFQTQPALLVEIASALRKLHGGPKFQGDFNFPGLWRNYQKTVMANGYFMPEEFLDVQPLVQQLENILAARPEEKLPCNNDLLAENFMHDGNKIWIIDYEYAGQNEPSFEIGNLASESGLTELQMTQLCDAYWLQHLPLKIARAKAWSMIARYGWVMWASIQEAVSPIDFDFRGWGLKKWNTVLPELKGEPYLKLLSELNNAP
jgi:thiamine kinase-like enzyme